jgi:hypothetical protein
MTNTPLYPPKAFESESFSNPGYCPHTQLIKRLIEMHGESRFSDMNVREDIRKPSYNRLGFRYGYIDDTQRHHYHYYFLENALLHEIKEGLRKSKTKLSARSLLARAVMTMTQHGFLQVEDSSALTLTPFNVETGEPALCFAVSSDILNYGAPMWKLEALKPRIE